MTLTFWLIGAALALLVGVAVLLPLWRANPRADTSQTAINAGIFRERLQELDQELVEGRIDAERHAQLRAELERTLLSDAPASERAGATRDDRWLASTLALLVLSLAVGYYYLTSYSGEAGAWLQAQSRLQPELRQALAQPDRLPDLAPEALPDFTRALQSRALAEGLRDPDTLHLLGLSLLQLQAYPSARQVLAQARELAPERDDLAVAEAQARILANDGRLDDTARALLEQVLARRPEHRNALVLLGFGAYNSGDYGRAIDAWSQLLERLPSDSETARLLSDNVAEARRLLARAEADAGGTETTVPDTEDSGDARIAVTVNLAPELREQLTPQDTLFVFAKAAAGPPMPLAVVRQPADRFPVSVVLDDSQAMMPELKLSNFPRVVVNARISKAGGVAAQPGDLQGSSGPLELNGEPLSVSLTVDQVVQ
ncbi:MAG: c-type cytochrome biogenesis protein CcmI [Candidatus Competibacterales bacterium]|nr:c-type cytochrome biogenesis protein CcmI [Candidatus Competibacterales bacterium]